ncbi:MAG TPA: hypothetical protein VE224_14660, partial [Pseudolabrys sp.]|nr:hypothetical protein [Pseudolabrys sp.]
MRHKRLLLPILLAFTVAACARQQSGYYVTDSATGLRVPTAGGENTGGERGLFTAWSRESDGNRTYGYAGGQNQESTERGLFGTSSGTPRYAYAPQTTYSYAPPQQAPAPAPQQQPARRYA